MAGDDDDLYEDLYATGEQDSQQPSSSTLSSDDFGLDEPSSSTLAANKPAASSGGSSFIPAASSTSGGAKSSFIPAASGSSSSMAAKGGSFIPPAASNTGTGSPMPQPQQSIHQQVQQHSQQQPAHQQQPQQSSLPQPLGTGQASSSEDGKMFVGGLSWDTSEDALKKYFSQFGKVLDCNIMKDPNTGTSRGFGFLKFEDPRAVNTIMVREHVLDGKIIDPKRAIPRDTSMKSSKIFVGGVPPNTTNESFRTTFLQFGKILDHNLMIDKETGNNRGFGFVTFESEDSGRKALDMDGRVMLDGKAVDIKRATSKNAPGSNNEGSGSSGTSNNNRRSNNNNNQSNTDSSTQQQQGNAMGMFNPMMGAGGGGGMDLSAMSSMFAQNGWGTGSWNPALMQQMLMTAQAGQSGGAGAWNPMMMGGMGGMGMGGGGMMGMGGGDQSYGMGGMMGGYGQQQQQQQGGMRGFAGNQGYGQQQQRYGNNNSMGMMGGGGMMGQQQQQGGMQQRGGNMNRNAPTGPSAARVLTGGDARTLAGGSRSPERSRDGNSSDPHRRERSPNRRGAGGDRFQDRPLR